MSIRFASAFAVCLLLALPAAAQKKGDPVKGKEVYEQCGVCHAATTNEKKMGPSLKGLYKKAKMANGKAVNDATRAAMACPPSRRSSRATNWST